MNKYLITAIAALFGSSAMSQDLTVEQILGQYNAVTRGDMISAQAVEGRVFVNGNLSGSRLSVGSHVSGGGAVLAVNGNSGVSDTRISNGDAYVNGHASGTFARATNGGEVHVGGTFSGSADSGMVRASQGDLSSHMPSVNFDAVETYSSSLAGLTGRSYTGCGFNERGNALASEGFDWVASDVTVYDTSLAELASGKFKTDLSANKTMIVNVSGTSGSYGLIDFAGKDVSQNILWNFYEATDLALNSTIVGSVLAPKATISGFDGSVEGSVLAYSISQIGGDLRSQPFSGDLPSFQPTVVPEIGAEGAMAAVVLVLGSMAVMAGRRRGGLAPCPAGA